MTCLRIAAPLALALAGAASAGLAQDYSEAPGLAERAAAGELPPVAERVGEAPEVITPLDEVGTYGGTLRRGLRGSSDHNNILRIMSPQGLTRWNREFTEVVPNVAQILGGERGRLGVHLRAPPRHALVRRRALHG